MYDPNKPIWTATFAELKEFFDEVGLTSLLVQPEQVERREGCSRGLYSLCQTLGIGRDKVLKLKKQGVFKDSVWQECRKGAIVFDPQLVIKQYAEYCSNQ